MSVKPRSIRMRGATIPSRVQSPRIIPYLPLVARVKPHFHGLWSESSRHRADPCRPNALANPCCHISRQLGFIKLNSAALSHTQFAAGWFHSQEYNLRTIPPEVLRSQGGSKSNRYEYQPEPGPGARRIPNVHNELPARDCDGIVQDHPVHLVGLPFGGSYGSDP